MLWFLAIGSNMLSLGGHHSKITVRLGGVTSGVVLHLNFTLQLVDPIAAKKYEEGHSDSVAVNECLLDKEKVNKMMMAVDLGINMGLE